ncbi:uncharacterized protein LOC115157351 isoform X1 [Salmo trutta]|uniref:Uncharacterized LOC115157351 n=1 Tax=Salmo trutta TaxID=8032 RepID=A0A673XTC4_SALTR|nr:uncharacterized protein LOC115157351 isoform X1 [Salmo trutta]
MQTLREEKGPPLPLSSLRLFIPPLRLVCAALWQVVERRDIMDYGLLEEFATSVLEIVPELMTYRERVQLIMGLRARLVLELCRCDDELCRPDTVQPHLNRIRSCVSNQKGEVSDPKVEASEASFMKLIETLLEQPEERELFFQNVFPEEYGPKYDSTLQILVWEFLSRLEKLIPAPNLKQTASWLSLAPALLEECVQSVAHPEPLQALLHHHKNGHHLDTNALRSTGGDYILSSLSFPSSVKEEIASCQAGPERQSYPTIKGYQTPFPSDQPEMSWDCRKADRKVWTVKPPARSASVEVEVKTIEDATEITVKRKTINKEMIKETRRDKAVLCPQTRSGLKTSRLTASCLRRQPVLRLNRLDIGNMPLPKSLLTLILRRGRLQAETRRPGPKGIDRKKKRRRGRGITNKKIETHTLDISVMPLPKSPLTLTLKRGVLLDDPTSSQVQKKRGRKKGAKIGPGITRLKIEKIGAHTLDISNVPLPKPSLKLVIRRGKLQAEATSSQGKKTRGRKKKWRRRCGVKNEGVKRERSPETEEEAEPSDNELWTSVNTGVTLNERAPVDESGGVHASHFPSSHKREEEQPIQTFHTKEHSGHMAEGQNSEEVSEIVAQDSLTPEPSNTSHKIHSEEHRGQMAEGQNREEPSEIVPQDSLTPEPSNTSHKINSEEHRGQMAEGQNREEPSEIVPQDSLTPEPSNTSHKIHSEEHRGQMAEGQNREEPSEIVPQDSLTPEPSNTSHKIHSEEHSGQMAKGQNREEPSEIVPQDSLIPEPSNTSHKIHSEEHSGQMAKGQNREEPSEIVPQDSSTPEPSNTSHKIHSEEHSGHMFEGQNREELPEMVSQDSLTPEPSNTSHKINSEERSGHMFEGQKRDELPDMVPQDLRTPEQFNTSHKVHSEEHSGHMFEEQNRDELPEMVPQDLLTPESSNTSHKVHSDEHSGQMAEGQKREEVSEIVPQDSLSPEPSNTSHKGFHLQEHSGHMAEGENIEKPLESVPKDLLTEIVLQHSLTPEPPNSSHKRSQRLKACSFCGKTFTDTLGLTRHMRSHIEQRSYQCTQCGQDYDSSEDLEEHQKRSCEEKIKKDNGEDNGGETVQQKTHLKRDKKPDLKADRKPDLKADKKPDLKGHTKDRTIKCHVCGKVTTRMLGLRRHLLLHFNNGAYKCPVCPTTFITNADLRSHLRLKRSCREKCSDEVINTKVHLQSNPGEYKCPYCGDTFQLPHDLKGHTKDCSRKCHVCGKTTLKPCGMRRHMLRHNNNGPYKCPVCPRTFISHTDLKMHLKKNKQCREKCSDVMVKELLSSVDGRCGKNETGVMTSCQQPSSSNTGGPSKNIKEFFEQFSYDFQQSGNSTSSDVNLNSLNENHSQEFSQYQPMKDIDLNSLHEASVVTTEDYSDEISQYQPMKDVDPLKDKKSVDDSLENEMPNDKEPNSTIGLTGKQVSQTDTKPLQDSQPETSGEVKNEIQSGKLQAEATGSHGQKRRGRKRKQKRGRGVKNEKTEAKGVKRERSPETEEDAEPSDNKLWTTVCDSGGVSESVPQDSLTPEPSNTSHKRSQRVKACSFCRKTFTETLGLTRHMRSHIEQRSYQCTLCGQDFEFSEDLEEHQKSSCEKKSGDDYCGETVQQKKYQKKNPDLKRDKMPDLKGDKKTHLNRANKTNLKRDKKSDLKGHTKDGSIKCHVCGKVTTRIVSLQRHLLLHFNNGAYKCPVCPKTFILNCDLRSHLRLKRSCGKKCSDKVITTRLHLKSNPGDYKCPYCGDTFQLPRDLKGHTKDCSKKCHVCGKISSRMLEMRRHMLKHKNNGPIKCPVCPKTFLYHTDLKKHLKTKKLCREKCSDVMVKDNADLKLPRRLKRSYRKTFSDDVITTKNHLKSNPGDYKCPYCGDTFQLPRDLKGHTKDCSRKCHVCGKTTSTARGMRRHMLRHNNNGAYKCPVCPRTFIYHPDLKKHLKLKKRCRAKCSDVMMKEILSSGDGRCRKMFNETAVMTNSQQPSSSNTGGPLKRIEELSHDSQQSDNSMSSDMNLNSLNEDHSDKISQYQPIKDVDLSSLHEDFIKEISQYQPIKDVDQSNPGEYKCPYCGDTFQLPEDLKRHTKDCSRKCHVCGKISSKACDMRRHMLKHDNNGPIKCPVCPKTFIFHTDLKTHLKTKKLCREKCSDVMAKELLSSVDGRCRKNVNETGVMTSCDQPSSSNTGGPSKSGTVLGLKSFEEFFEELSNDSDISMNSDVNLNSLDEDYSQEISQYQPIKDVDLNSLDEDYSQEISQYQPIKDVDLNSLYEDYSQEISQYQPIKDVDQSNPGKYNCPYCGKTFQLLYDLKGHKKDCSRKCHVCGKTTSTACGMRRHMLKHYNGPIKCPVCPTTFVYHTDLKKHLKTKKICREKCSGVMAKELLSSVDNRCTKNLNETGVMASCEQPSSSNTGGPSNSIEEFSHDLQKSDNSMSSDVNLNSLHEDNSQEISQYQAIKDIDQSNPGEYKCPYCGDTFQLPDDLKGHTKDCSRKCHVCGKISSKACDMRRHMLKHYNNGPIKCLVCPKTFIFHTDLKTHLKTKKLCREKCSDVMAKELLSSVDGRCRKNVNETGVMTRLQQPSSSNTGGPSKSGPVLGLKSFEEFFEELSNHSDISMSSDVNLNSLHEDYSQEISQYQPMKDVDLSILHEDYSQEISQYHPMKDTDLNSLHEDYSQEISHYQPMKDVDLNSLHEVYSDDISQYQPVKDIDPKEDRKFVNDSGVNEMPNDKEPNSTNCPRPLQDSI